VDTPASSPGYNPIVWRKYQYRWQLRRVPYLLSAYEYENGSVATRRLRPPGWVLLHMAMAPFVVHWFEHPKRMYLPDFTDRRYV